jgi:prepilin-type N-terminal cleavage/methylation domain-containing protein
MSSRRASSQRGFTIIELIVSISIFIIVMTVSSGALLSIVNADKKAQATRNVMDNLNFAIDTIARNIRLGSTYYCPSPTGVNQAGNGGYFLCAINSGAYLVPFFAVTTQKGQYVSYSYDPVNHQIDEAFYTNNTYSTMIGTPQAITAPEITISQLQFLSQGDGVSYPSHTIIIVRGASGTGSAATAFNIETSASQR